MQQQNGKENRNFLLVCNIQVIMTVRTYNCSISKWQQQQNEYVKRNAVCENTEIRTKP